MNQLYHRANHSLQVDIWVVFKELSVWVLSWSQISIFQSTKAGLQSEWTLQTARNSLKEKLHFKEGLFPPKIKPLITEVT